MADSSTRKKMKISDLEQRVEDLEDLVMVENAGIEELKNLMMNINTKMESEDHKSSQPAEIPQDLKEKLSLLDEMRKAVNDLETKTDDMEGSLESIREGGMPTSGDFSNKDLKSIDKKLSNIGSRIDSVEKATRNIDSTDRKLSNLESKIDSVRKVPGEVDAVKNRISGFESTINKRVTEFEGMINKRVTENESSGKVKLAEFDNLRQKKIGEFENLIKVKLGEFQEMREKKLSGFDSRIKSIEKISENLNDEMENTRRTAKNAQTVSRNISTIDSRVDAIEKLMKTVSGDTEEMRLTFKKFDSFEKMSDLAKDLRRKTDELKLVQNEVNFISEKVEGFYKNLGNRLDRMNEFERVFPELKQKVQSMREETMKKIDENKVLVIDKASKDETSSLRDRVNQLEQKLNKSDQEIGKLMDDASVPDDPMSVVKVELSDLMSRIVAIETRIGNVENIMQRKEKAPIILE